MNSHSSHKDSQPCGFIASSSFAVLDQTHVQRNGSNLLSRREVIVTLSAIPLFMSASAAAQNLPKDPRGLQRILRERCERYISLIHPVRQDALLWRGARTGDDVGIRSPPSDLLWEETYGAQGASFFDDLDRYLRDNQTENTVLPSRAHVATGDRQIAAKWGVPVSVWPVGPFRYAFWRDGTLIYEDEETLEQSMRRGGQLIAGQGLRDALVHGKEVMFEAQAYFELSEELTSKVLPGFL